MFIEQKDLVEQIISRAERVQGMDLENITIPDAAEYYAITEDLALATQKYSIRTILMKSFLMYSITCAIFTIVAFKFLDANPLLIAFSNLAIAACISAWMTYKLYLCSTSIESIFGSYDKFLARVSQKGKEE